MCVYERDRIRVIVDLVNYVLVTDMLAVLPVGTEKTRLTKALLIFYVGVDFGLVFWIAGELLVFHY